MAIVGAGTVLIRPTFSGFQKDVQKELGGTGEAAGRTAGQSLGDSLATWGKRGAIVAGGAIAAVAGTALVKGFGRLQAIENAQAKLRGLGHDADAVRQIMDNALASVKGTAFGLGEAATIAASAVAAGIKPGEQLTGHLKNVANTAAAAGISMEEMGNVFNRAATQANGVQNDVISQLADRGIPIYQALAEQMGVTAGEVFKMASEGKVDFETFAAAAESAAGTVADEMGGTLSGAFQNTLAALGRVGANLMSGVFPYFADFFNGTIDFLGPFEDKAKQAGEALGEWMTRGAEGVKTFIAEWQAGSGLGGTVAEWMGRITTAATVLFDTLVSVGRWLADHKGLVIGVAVAYGTLRLAVMAHTAAMAVQAAGGFGAMLLTWARGLNLVQVATRMAAAVQWLWNAAMSANPIGIVITAVAALVGALVWFFTQTEVGQRIFTAAWEGIKTAAAAVADWFTGTALPVLQAVWNGIAAGATWLWQTILRPVFSAISSAFQTVGGFILSVWVNVIKFAWDAMVFTAKWLWNSVLSPIFGWIGDAWNVLAMALKLGWELYWKPAWDAISAAAQYLWTTVLQPIFGWIGQKWGEVLTGMKVAWELVLKPVFQAVAGFVRDHVVPGFRTAVDTLKSIWEGLKAGFAAPINWVIRTVWNDGIVSMFEKAAVAIGSSARLPRVREIGVPAYTAPSQGGRVNVGQFAKGGLARGWAVVGEEGPELVNFTTPGRVYTASQTAAALGGAGEGSEGGNAGSVASIVGSVAGWVRGGLAAAASAIADPDQGAHPLHGRPVGQLRVPRRWGGHQGNRLHHWVAAWA